VPGAIRPATPAPVEATPADEQSSGSEEEMTDEMSDDTTGEEETGDGPFQDEERAVDESGEELPDA